MARPSAQRAIAGLEREVRRAKARLVAARRRLSPEPVADYVFRGRGGRPLRLSEAFGAKEDLLAVHDMGRRCPMRTAWTDGLDGILRHLEDRAGSLRTSPDPAAVQERFRRRGGWRFRMASTSGTPFDRDMAYGDDEGRPSPGVSAFHRAADGALHRRGTSSLGPGDDFCVIFPRVALPEDGQGGWWPRREHGPRRRARRREAR